MGNILQQEFEFYLAHQDELVKKYDGKYIVLKGQKVIGVFDDELSAVTETQKSHELGTFLVQLAEPGNSAYSQTFHSRAAFC